MASFDEQVQQARSEIVEVQLDELVDHLDGGCVVVDVREKHEFDDGSLPGAVNVPLGSLADNFERLAPERNASVLVLCASGARSALGARRLGELGYQNVVSLAGGYHAWTQHNGRGDVDGALTATERERYARHLRLPEVGEVGQQALGNARVLVVGAGGLGCPVALYLAAAGVGTLGIVDNDVVERSNLQRQIAHRDDRVGMAKTESIQASINGLNPDVAVVSHHVRLDATNAESLLADYDLVVDGSDNFSTRYVLNDASVRLGLPVVHGSIFRFEGQVSVFDPRRGPTYRDLLPSAPADGVAPPCAEAGVLGVLPGIVGSLQALEAIKVIVGVGDPLIGRLLVFDALAMEFYEMQVACDPANQVTWANRNQIVISDR